MSGKINRSDVVDLQKLLNKQGFNCGAEDGIAGSRTLGAYEALGLSLRRNDDGKLSAKFPLWNGSFSPPSRLVDTVFVHCSASDNPAHDNAETMDAWHRKRGFDCIGYHYFVRKNGEVQIGRNIEHIPAAQEGYNTGTIAICLHGLDKEKFTEAQFSSLRRLCRAINSLYGGGIVFRGHKEVAAKECPVFDYKAVLGLDGKGMMNETHA